MMPSHCRRSDWLGISSHSGVHTGRSDTWVTVLISGSGSGWLAPAKAAPSRKAGSQRHGPPPALVSGQAIRRWRPWWRRCAPAGRRWRLLAHVVAPSEHLDPDAGVWIGGSNAMCAWGRPSRRQVTIDHQIRRLVVSVHKVRLSAVCAAQVRCRIPARPPERCLVLAGGLTPELTLAALESGDPG